MDIKIGDEIEILINDTVFKAEVYSIDTRETAVDIMTYYTMNFKDKDETYTLSLSKIKYKKDIDNYKLL